MKLRNATHKVAEWAISHSAWDVVCHIVELLLASFFIGVARWVWGLRTGASGPDALTAAVGTVTIILIGILVVWSVFTAAFRSWKTVFAAQPTMTSTEPKLRVEELEGGGAWDLKGRPKYLDTIIEQVEKAQHYVYLCVHTLEASRTSEKILSLQKGLVNASARGVDVRVLTPDETERIEATHELNKTRHIATRALSHLEDEDMRFSLFDDDVIVVSTRPPNKQEPSSACAVIISRQLNGLLKRFFEQEWDCAEAWPYEKYLKEIVTRIRSPGEPISEKLASDIARRLRIPATEVQRALGMRENKSP